MHKKEVEKMGLQVFAAPDGMTGSAQIQVKAREIDFVTSFSKNINALLDVLGIAKMIRKENGATLKTKKVSGTLESGDVGEGEEIPMSQYTVDEEEFGKIKIEKYRKGVPIEVIADKGYDAAVQSTDNEFRADLQNKVTDKLYAQLKAGSLVGHESTWQMAVAMAIGKVKDKFDTMGRTATGVVAWVNTLDVYKYVGAANISTQTAFGMTYVKEFLGADLVFISSKIPESTVVATPINNLIAYYVDPGDSEFAKAGLSYTTDTETGFIGFHAEGNYSRALSEMYALMGITIMAEYQDAIANIAVGGSDTQKLGALTVGSTAGETVGFTKITVDEPIGSPNNKLKYKEKSGSAESVTYGMDVKAWTKWDGKSEIKATSGNHITVVECDQNYKAVRFGDVVAAVKA